MEVVGEFVKVLGDHDIVVEAFVEVGFVVVVEIVEACDLVATMNVDDIVDDFETEGMEESCCVSFPLDVLEVLVDSGDDPDIAAPSADGCATIGEEVEATNPHA